MVRLLRQFLHDLHTRRARANDGYFLPFDAQILRPKPRMVNLPFELVQSGEIRIMPPMQQARRENKIFPCRHTPIRGRDGPPSFLLIVADIHDPRLKLHILPQIQRLVDMRDVFPQLSMIGEALAEVPRLVHFRDVKLVEGRF